MKLFTSNNFHGRWPVPTAAVIVAETKEEAEHLLLAELNTRKLRQDNHPFTVEEVDLGIKQVVILSEGEY